MENGVLVSESVGVEWGQGPLWRETQVKSPIVIFRDMESAYTPYPVLTHISPWPQIDPHARPCSGAIAPLDAQESVAA